MTIGEAAPTDRELVARVRAGEAAAFDRIVARYQGKVLAVCRRYARDESSAWDLWQEAFMKLHGSLDRWTEGDSIGAWLMRIAVNTGLDAARKKKTWLRLFRPFGEGEEAAAREGPGIPEPPDPGLGEALRAGISRLPPMQRDAVTLRFFGELSVAEVAEVLGCSESSAKTHLSRGLTRLRGIVRPVHIDGEV